MKKTLIALAALAATSAFAQVTITGTFDPSIAASNTTYNTAAGDQSLSQNFVRNNSQGTSQITFKGVEDLGGGMSAMFLYEGDFTSAAGASAANSIGGGGGEIYTALSGGFGTVKLGAPNTPSLTVQAARQPFGTKIGSGFGGVLGTSHVREDNSLNYTSPVFAGGLTAAVNYTFGTNVAAPGTNVNAKTDIGLIYAAGPLFAGVSFYKQDGTNQQTNMALSYDFGMAKVMFGVHNETATVAGVDNQSSGTNLGVAVPFGKITLLANVAQLDDKSAANLDKTISGIGARYDLSKRTSVYGRYVAEKNDNVVAANGIKAVNTTLVGVQHNF
ncbi:MAG: porin [Burkholderiales bacterium]|nr:porin [Burkholderiales bacterium]